MRLSPPPSALIRLRSGWACQWEAHTYVPIGISSVIKGAASHMNLKSADQAVSRSSQLAGFYPSPLKARMCRYSIHPYRGTWYRPTSGEHLGADEGSVLSPEDFGNPLITEDVHCGAHGKGRGGVIRGSRFWWSWQGPSWLPGFPAREECANDCGASSQSSTPRATGACLASFTIDLRPSRPRIHHNQDPKRPSRSGRPLLAGSRPGRTTQC
jgi:hypothetical protein